MEHLLGPLKLLLSISFCKNLSFGDRPSKEAGFCRALDFLDIKIQAVGGFKMCETKTLDSERPLESGGQTIFIIVVR